MSDDGDMLRFKVFIETPCVCDHSDIMEINPIAWEACETDDQQESLLARAAQEVFFESCSYGWSGEPIGDESA